MSIVESLLSATLGAGFSSGFMGWYLSARFDRRSRHDDHLRDKRLAPYQRLWAELEPFAQHAPPAPLTYRDLGRVAGRVRAWYYREGGVLLTAASRDLLFALLEACIDAAGQGSIALPAAAEAPVRSTEMKERRRELGLLRDDEIDVAALLGGVAARTWGRSPTDDYVLLFTLSSALRTSLSNDLLSRLPPDMAQELTL